jgi:hypothetical protein
MARLSARQSAGRLWRKITTSRDIVRRVGDRRSSLRGFDAHIGGTLPFAAELVRSTAQFIIEEASDKPAYGKPVFASVASRKGTIVGAFLYHLRPGRIGHVLQVLARPNQVGAVLDCLIDHATSNGAVGLRGRTQPALMESMLGRRIIFVSTSATVVHSRQPEIVEALRRSEGFVNGMAGELWSRLSGGCF